MVQAVILVGGLGTRLRSRVPDLPKALAPINGKPFLLLLIKELEKHPCITKLVLAVGYKSECIQSFLDSFERSIPIEFSYEEFPLGTGGAVKQALELTEGETVLVMNGDSFIPFRLEEFLSFHKEKNANISILSTEVEDSSRFGALKTEEDTNRILAFEEKGHTQSNTINAGVYLINRALFSSFKKGEAFSLEKDFFPLHCVDKMYSFLVQEPFIDIGTPPSFDEAQTFFKVINIK